MVDGLTIVTKTGTASGLTKVVSIDNAIKEG